MRVKDVQSLVWLHRWHNGRAKRMEELYESHLAAVTLLVIDELHGYPQELVELTLCGFLLRISPAEVGLQIHSIEPPSYLAGEQLGLFEEEGSPLTLPTSNSKEVKHGIAA